MNTPRALLISVLATLAACGGGGADDPPPQVLFETSGVEAGGDPTASARRSVLMRASPSPSVDRAASGEQCVDGTWRQTATGPGDIWLSVDTSNFAVQPGGAPVVIRRTAAAAGVVEFPFRLCNAWSSAGSANMSAQLSLSAQSQGSPNLGAFTAQVRWSIVGTYR